MAATEDIWREFHERLLGFIKKRVNHDELAKDMLQEVFIKIHQGIDSIQDEKRITSWVYQITRNTIIDHFRKKKELTAELPTNDVLPEELEDQFVDFTHCVAPFIKQLNEKDQEILKTVSFGNVSQKEYAEHQNISYSTAKSRVQRAREKLKESFIACCNIESDVYGNIISHSENNCDC